MLNNHPLDITNTAFRTDQDIKSIREFLSQSEHHVKTCSGCKLFKYRTKRDGGWGDCFITGEVKRNPACMFERGDYCPFPSVGGDESWRRLDQRAGVFSQYSYIDIVSMPNGEIRITTKNLTEVCRVD